MKYKTTTVLDMENEYFKIFYMIIMKFYMTIIIYIYIYIYLYIYIVPIIEMSSKDKIVTEYKL